MSKNLFKDTKSYSIMQTFSKDFSKFLAVCSLASPVALLV